MVWREEGEAQSQELLAERIHVWRSGRGSSIGHFTGFGISLIIWSSWFGIWKKNRGEIRYWKFAREVGRQKQPSGLRDCTKLKVGITGLKDHSWGPSWEAIGWGGNAPSRECPHPPSRDSDVKNARSVPTFPDRARPIFPWPCLRDVPTSTSYIGLQMLLFLSAEPQGDWDQVKLIVLSLLRRKKVSRA